MVAGAAIDFEGAIDLLVKDKAGDLVGESEGREGEEWVGL